MTEAAIQEAQDAFAKMVSSQVARATSELNRLDELLKAGRVDGRVLSEFRSAVDRIRTSGWQVQVWLEGDERALSVLLMEERIRAVTRLASQLAAEITACDRELRGVAPLKDAMAKLDGALTSHEVPAER
jgi:multidrug resistance efflux pump